MTTTELRCAECGSLVRAGDQWCSLCHADLRSDEEKEAARLEAEQLASAGITLPTDALVDASTNTVGAAAAPRGRHARPSVEVGVAAHRPTLTAAPATSADLPGLTASVSTIATAAETEEKLAELKEAGVDVDGMLQMLASSSVGGPLDGLIDRVSSKGSRAIVVIVASTVLTALGIGLMFLLGSFFG